HSDEKLKNISMPVEIFWIQLPWLAHGHRSRPVTKKILKLAAAISAIILIGLLAFFIINNQEAKASPGNKLRLAVLPLKNISNNPQDEYFADGMTEELISGISKIGGLNVIARTSIMKYKQTDKDISTIGRELM